MTVRRIYTCDLCDAAPVESDLLGVTWGGGRRLRLRASAAESTCHICRRCLAALRDGEPE